MGQYKDRLDIELGRMEVRAAVLTINESNSRDPSAALYFTRPPAEDDFSWQDTLGISNPDPTTEEIEEKFRAMLKGLDQSLVDSDRDLRYQLNEARKRALAFATGNYGKENELAIRLRQVQRGEVEYLRDRHDAQYAAAPERHRFHRHNQSGVHRIPRRTDGGRRCLTMRN